MTTARRNLFEESDEDAGAESSVLSSLSVAGRQGAEAVAQAFTRAARTATPVPSLVRVQVVMLGALVDIEYEGTEVSEVLGLIRAQDPKAEFRTAFPMKGGGFGGRDTKIGRALAIQADFKESGAFIKLISRGADGKSLTISVGKDKAPTFVADVKALGKLSDVTMAELEAAASGKSSATVMLDTSEQFGVQYNLSQDGRNAWANGYQAEAPAA